MKALMKAGHCVHEGLYEGLRDCCIKKRTEDLVKRIGDPAVA
jgi:hypothetical protein